MAVESLSFQRRPSGMAPANWFGARATITAAGSSINSLRAMLMIPASRAARRVRAVYERARLLREGRCQHQDVGLGQRQIDAND